ncbi:MAG: prefoldin subunit [Candidatus Parvarchaeota archaeon]|nr:prefoldin subunit [Candidatus Parvarchaeota archaeon]MCL5100988.1 prefoldin subunit [Candidatus Parvarchaeota archaeon]
MNEEDYDTLRQQLQLEMSQKQTLQLQYNEITRTIEEVEKNPENEKLFELVGQVLVSKDKKDLMSALKEKSEILEFRLKNVNKSVDELTKKLQEAQKALGKH